MELETLSAKDRSAVVHKTHCARENLILTRNQGRIDRPLIRTGTQQRVLPQVPGDNLERNRKRKLKSKARKAKAKRLGNYFPRDSWREMGRRGLRHLKYDRQMDVEPMAQVGTVTQEACSSRPRAELCDMDGPSTEATWEACENRPQALLRTDKLCLGGEYFGNGRSGGIGYKRKITVTRQIRSHGCQDELYEGSSRMENVSVTRQVRSHGCQGELYDHSSRKEDFTVTRQFRSHGSQVTPSTSSRDHHRPNYVPAGYESEQEDEIDNDYVTSRMIGAGIYPKKKRTGFERY